MDIGATGVWTRMDGFSATEAIDFAQRVEELGYGALWIPDAFGRDPFAHAAMLFQHTKRLVIATGVVNIHLREAQATRLRPARAARTIGGALPARPWGFASDCRGASLWEELSGPAGLDA